jgi:hypothetical protein
MTSILIKSSLGDVKQAKVFSLLDMPADMQRVILGYVPLSDFARLACVSKELRTAYVERVTERDATVTAMLQSHFTAGFREGLSPAQTVLPWDLIVSPQVGELRSLQSYIVYKILY